LKIIVGKPKFPNSLLYKKEELWARWEEETGNREKSKSEESKQSG
jgi:hypothetical protein